MLAAARRHGGPIPVREGHGRDNAPAAPARRPIGLNSREEIMIIIGLLNGIG